MNRNVKISLPKRTCSLLLCVCLVLMLTVVGCRKDDLPRVPDGAVIQDSYYTEDTANSTSSHSIDTTATTTTTTQDNVFMPNNYYFLNNYLENKTAVINQLLQNSGNNSEAFVFITDPHTEQKHNAGQTSSLVNYLCARTDLSRAIIGGDVFIGTSPTYAAEMAEAFTDGQVHYVMGNHEYDRGTTDQELVNTYHVNKPEEIGNIQRHYYYVDSPDNKLRYVVLNGWEEGAENVATDLATAQNQWLKDEALQVADGWGILVFCHQFVNRGWTENRDIRGFGTVWKPIAKTLLEYDGAGEILAVFHGHIHQDMISRMRMGTDRDGNVAAVLDDDCGGIPLIGTAANKHYTDKETSPYEFLVEREEGTITEQAFDVVVVDRENGQIHCVRIGAPARDGTGWLDQPQVEVRTINIRE